MAQDRIYHESVVKYNAALAECAEKTAPTIEDPTVAKWCAGVGRQHRRHQKRHQRALDRINARGGTGEEKVERIVEGMDVPEPEETDEQETQAILDDPDTMDAIAEAEAEVVEEKPQNTQSDGCGKFHDPSNPNCEFSPLNKTEVNNG